MRIVVDAFGADACPVPDVEGAVLAAREWGDEIILVGPEARVRQELAKHDTQGLNIRVVHAPQVLTMEDHSDVVRRKRESSVRVGMRLVKQGEADAFVSAGNTIAVLSGAIFDLRRIRGIRRPAIATIYPVGLDPVLLLDIGATADPKPEYLLQFAQMGTVYAERVLGIANPRVGLLSNGEEPEKGNMVVRDTFHVLRESALNFVGNVEPKEVTRGVADVVVTDGFTGNIMLKTSEAIASFIVRVVKRDLLGGPMAKVGLALLLPGLVGALPGLLLLYPSLRRALKGRAWLDTPLAKVGLILALPGVLGALPGLLLLAPGLRRMRKRLDYAEYGGALLMGVDGVVIVAHGRSNAKAIKNAIRQARLAVSGKVIATIKAGLHEAKSASDQPSENTMLDNADQSEVADGS